MLPARKLCAIEFPSFLKKSVKFKNEDIQYKRINTACSRGQQLKSIPPRKSLSSDASISTVTLLTGTIYKLYTVCANRPIRYIVIKIVRFEYTFANLMHRRTYYFSPFLHISNDNK